MSDPPDGSDESDVDVSSDIGLPTQAALEACQFARLATDQAVAVLNADGKIRVWTEGSNRPLGYEASDLVDGHYRDLFPTDRRDASEPQRLLERARSEGRIEDVGWIRQDDDSRTWARQVLVSIRDRDLAAVDDIGPSGQRGDDTDVDALLGYTVLLQDRTEQRYRERELQEEQALTRSIFRAQPDIVYAFDREGNYLQWSDRVTEVTGYTDAELAEMGPLEFIAPEHRDRIAEAIERILADRDHVTAEADLQTKDGTRIPYEFNSAPMTDDDGTVIGFTGVGRDVSDRKARERELERLEHLNATIRAVDETLVTAESREEIERAVVDAFAAADAYRFAVVGRSSPTDDGSWEPRTWAGIDDDAVDRLETYVHPSDRPGPSPLENQPVQRYQDLPESDVDAWRRDARERGYGAVAVVPIVAGGHDYGAVVVAADDSGAFGDREREVLQEFGGTIGHAINAIAVRRLLYQDSAVELGFRSTDRQGPLVDLSRDAGCRLAVDHLVPLQDGVYVFYASVERVDPDRIRSVAADHPSIVECRLIDADDDGTDWEFVVDGPTLAELLAEYGGRIRSQVIDDGVARTHVQISPDLDVRDLVDAVTTTYPEIEFVSKRTVERAVETPGDFRRRVQESLTDKQQAALEAAYYGGYFEWPRRRSDASDVADRLGIARQTFHQHLRVAELKLLEVFLEDEPPETD